MGANLGFFAEDRERDFPELNKCPDCETFFADLNCPLCGKECPEEFRAGNRKPLKQKKHRRSSGNGRVQFVPWYHSVWFIVAMLIIQPIIGLILTWTGVWKTHWKIIVTILVILPYILGGVLGIVLSFIDDFSEITLPVNTSITEEEYRARCEEVDVETLYRHSNDMMGEYVKLTVTILHIETSVDVYEPTAYVCQTEKDGKTWDFIMLDYRTEGGSVNFVKGDTVTFYGEVYNTETFYWNGGSTKAPWIACLYADLIS